MNKMAKNNSDKIHVAKPYDDIDTPFSIDEKGALAEYIINDPEKMPQLALGATILIRDKRKEDFNSKPIDFWYSGRIIGLKTVSPFNPERTTMLYEQDEEMDPRKPLENINGPHTHQPFVIKVSLSQEWTLDELKLEQKKYTSSAIQRPPSGLSRLFFPTISSDRNYNAPSLEVILKIKEQGLEFGMIGFGNKPYGWKSKKFLPYKWDVDKLDNKHMFIVGESGSGKTVFLKNLAYQIKKHNPKNKIILTDVQGDITQLLFWDLLKGVPRNSWEKKLNNETIHNNYKNAKEIFGKIRLIIPLMDTKISDEQVIQLKRLGDRQENVSIRTINLRFQDLDFPSDVEYLFRTSSNQAALLLDDLADGIKSSGDKPSIARLQSAIARLLTRNSGNEIVLPTNGVSYRRSTFEATRRVLGNLEKYFDGDKDALKEDRNPLDAFDFPGTTIFYLEHLNQEERFMWEMQLVSWLYKNKKKMQNSYVFFDEAHQIIPKDKSGGSSIDKNIFSRLRSNFEKLAREGRKFRLNLILSTQSPQDLHPIVQEQCPTRVVMKINKKNAEASGLDKGLAHIANNFSHGQFWIQSPFNGTPDWVRVHSVAPPVPHESMDKFREKLENSVRF